MASAIIAAMAILDSRPERFIDPFLALGMVTQ